MLKIIKVLFTTVLLFSLLSQPSFAASASTKIKITLVSVELIENNHVGNEWYTSASVNGKEIAEGATVTLNVKSTDIVKLEAYAEEQDKIPDVGTATASIKVSSISKKLSKALNVTVVENRGRYSGNTAIWKYTFTVQKL